jgi:hypothetical protein
MHLLGTSALGGWLSPPRELIKDDAHAWVVALVRLRRKDICVGTPVPVCLKGLGAAKESCGKYRLGAPVPHDISFLALCALFLRISLQLLSAAGLTQRIVELATRVGAVEHFPMY